MGAKSVVVAAGVAGACAAGALAAVMLAVPPVNRPAHEEYGFGTGTEAKEARPSFPHWIPNSASSITYALKRSSGEQLVKATLKEGKLPAECVPGTEVNAPAPKIEAAWFPTGVAGRAVVRCDRYYAYTDGSVLYAWQNSERHETK